jgi:uncharacterized Tic20 family protein
MNSINQSALKKDNQLLMLTHLSQLLTAITGFGGLIVPLIIWVTQKDKIQDMDEQGKEIVNFQLSLVLYSIISIPAIFLLGLGIIMLIAVGVLAFVMPIINAVNVNNGSPINYFGTIRFIS